jgi:hypothetical protein
MIYYYVIIHTYFYKKNYTYEHNVLLKKLYNTL